MWPVWGSFTEVRLAHTGAVEPSYRPPLTVHEVGDRCRLSLAGLAHGHGGTLQEAADDLVERLLRLVLSLRRSGLRFCRELDRPTGRRSSTCGSSASSPSGARASGPSCSARPPLRPGTERARPLPSIG